MLLAAAAAAAVAAAVAAAACCCCRAAAAARQSMGGRTASECWVLDEQENHSPLWPFPLKASVAYATVVLTVMLCVVRDKGVTSG